MMDALRKKVFSSMISEGTNLIRKLRTLNNNAIQVNRELLSDILKKNAGTEFGTAHGFGEIHTPEEYRERVRVSNYADYKPYFARMMEKGEKTCCLPATWRIILRHRAPLPGWQNAYRSRKKPSG